MSHKKPIVQVQNVFFAYHHSRTDILKNINFEVCEGESVALVGPNGAGKSTLASHLGGILFARSGSVLIDGVSAGSSTLKHIRHVVGLVFQNPDDQLFCPTVGEEIEFGLMNMKLSPSVVHNRTIESARAMNIQHLLQKPAHHLSGGEKKRVAIAAVLAMNPKILILDEPTANLDPQNEKVLTDLINSLSCTKMIISHDLPILFQTCQRILVMVDGQVRKDCPVQEFMLDRNLILEHGLDYRFKCKCCQAIHPERFPSTQQVSIP